MSVQEIQAQLVSLTPEELSAIERHIRLLRVINAPGYKERITAANRRLNAGLGVTQEEFEARLEQRAGDDKLGR